MQLFNIILLISQLALFTLGRVMDDMSWYSIGVANETKVFQGVSVAALSICIFIQIGRKYSIEGWWRILFIRSQLKFVISWALIGTILLLFTKVFGCASKIPQHEQSTIYLVSTECALNMSQIILTNLNISLICNTKAHLSELIWYQTVLFGQIIYNGNLFLMFIGSLEGHSKDYCILFISILIANQILIMDLIFRAAYQDKQRQEELQQKMVDLHKKASNSFTSTKMLGKSQFK